MIRVPVKPEMLAWALERADLTVDDLSSRCPRLPKWLEGEAQPTLRQLEDFARATRAPIGYFFLEEPPEEHVPIPDFRTIRDKAVTGPSPDLLDCIYICQQRQEWYRGFARTTGEPPLAFVGSADLTDDPDVVAGRIRDSLSFSIEERHGCRTWAEARRRFIGQAEDLGVLVMVSGVVGSNNRRKLDPAEFRGFALSDPLAPLIFINGADSQSAQMFTLAHELAHIWLGETALSDNGPRTLPSHDTERWCNRVAAELLVPRDAFLEHYRKDAETQAEIQRLARVFKVSTLVVLRRIYDTGNLSRARFWSAYDAEFARLRDLAPSSSGGDFYNTTSVRVGRRFASAIIASALEGRASFSEALRLLGFRRMSVFHDLGRAVGVDA